MKMHGAVDAVHTAHTAIASRFRSSRMQNNKLRISFLHRSALPLNFVATFGAAFDAQLRNFGISPMAASVTHTELCFDGGWQRENQHIVSAKCAARTATHTHTVHTHSRRMMQLCTYRGITHIFGREI